MNTHLSDSEIQAHADGERTPASVAHFDTCEECRSALESIRVLKSALSDLPREDKIERELYSGIRARIARPKPNYWKPLAIALAASFATFALWPKAVPERREDIRPEMRGAELIYKGALEDLVVDLDQKKDRLDAQTLEEIELNLKLIDEAIKASQSALDRDPGNREAAQMVASAYQSKLEMYRLIERTGQ